MAIRWRTDPVRIIARPLGLATLVAGLLLAGCAAPPPVSGPAPAGQAPAPPLPRKNATLYRIDRGASQLRIRVYRGGPLAAAGHNHVMVTSDIHGRIYVHHELSKSGFRLTIPVRSLRVDPEAAREQEGKGFESRPDRQDRAGTRRHMLGKKVLDASEYPDITLRSIAITGPPWYPRITVRITLHGTSRDYVVPTAVVHSGRRLIATGGLDVKQTDFGITPYSVLAGGLRVKNRIDIAFRLVAEPEPGRHR